MISGHQPSVGTSPPPWRINPEGTRHQGRLGQPPVATQSHSTALPAGMDGEDAVQTNARGALPAGHSNNMPSASPVLAEGLELVHELVDHVPQPKVGQQHVQVAVQDDCRHWGANNQAA